MASSIPATMKAVQAVEFEKPYEVHDIPVPRPGSNDLLVKMAAAGYCHTDYQVWQGVYKSELPIVPSHEPVGTVVAMGEKAAAAGKWKTGERVGVVMFKHACHNCLGCATTKDVRFCENKEMAGLSVDGGMQQYMLADADETVLLPDEVPFEQAAPLMCAGATTWVALQAADVPGAEPIAVIGVGGLGAFAIQFAKALGHPVVAIDNRSEGRALAVEVPLPADLVVDYDDSDAATKIKAWSGKGGVAAVLVCTDNIPALEWSLNILRTHGVAVPVGLPVEGFRVDAFMLNFSELTIKGSLVATRNQVEDLLQVVALHGIRNRITVVEMQDAPSLAELYMAPDLKGRLVLRLPA